MPQVGAIMLAAGVSRRFGADKRSHRLANKQTLLSATLQRYQQVFEHIRIVMRGSEAMADIAKLELHLRKDDEAIFAADSHLGMGHSLAAGARDLAWHGAVVALGDMPHVRADSLRQIRDTLAAQSQATIVRPFHNNRAGQPVGFTHHYFADLEQLRGDAGARQLIQQHASSLLRIDVDDAGVLTDYDRPEDLPS